MLPKTDYASYKRNGDFVFVINCNRKKIITDDEGVEQEILYTAKESIFTEFRGFITLEITEDEVSLDHTDQIDSANPLRQIRYKIKIPQQATKGNSFRENDGQTTDLWRRQHKLFKGGGIYSVAKFNGTVHNDNGNDNDQDRVIKGFSEQDSLNILPYKRIEYHVGLILTSDNDNDYLGNELTDFPSNYVNPDNNLSYFGAAWLNFAIYLPQIGYLTKNRGEVRDYRSNTSITQDYKSDHFYLDNEQIIAANQVNTKWFARSDLHYTDFIDIDKSDIINIVNNVTLKGGKLNEVIEKINENSIYFNGNSPCPENGGYVGANPNNSKDENIYFFRGLKGSDCLKLVYDLGLV